MTAALAPPLAVLRCMCDICMRMGDPKTCVDCKAVSPKTTTNYSLIGAQHGWRLTRTRSLDGTVLVEWRCQACWKAFKERGSRRAPEDATSNPVRRKRAE